MRDDAPPRTPWIYRFVKSRQGQSETLGFVLLLAVTIAGTGVIVAYGGPAITNTREEMRTKNVEHAMTQLDAKLAEVALGRSPTMVASLPSPGINGGVEVTDEGWIRVEVYNQTTGNLREEMINESLGAIEYTVDETEVVYQGGGVWRRQDGGSVMVSPPEFHYREETLTLPIVQVSGNVSDPNRVVIDRKSPTKRIYPNASEGRQNPLRDARVEITIKSDYYEAWGSFFESRTAGKPSYDHDRNRVTFTLVVTRETGTTVDAGVIAGGSTDLALDQNAHADAYNSSNDVYPVSQSDNVSIRVGGDFDMGNNANISGDLEAGGDVDIGKVDITGNLSYGGSYSAHKKANVEGWVAGNASVTEPDPVDWLINKKENQTTDGNDNDKADVDIQNDSTPRINNGNGDGDCDNGVGCRIEDGEYHLRKVDLDSDSNLTIDNEDGPVTIYVDGDFQLGQDTTVNLTDDGNPVRIYVEGDTDLFNNVLFEVPGDKAPLMWIYHNPGSSAVLHNNANFTGVIYGPGSASNDGVDVDLAQQTDVYGALVGKVQSIDETVDFHYDAALARETVVPDSQRTYIPTVNYLHITMNNVTVG